MKKTRDKIFWDFFLANLIYCEDTHSFTHRLYEKFKISRTEMGAKIEGDGDIQQIAFNIIEDMEKEFKKPVKMESYNARRLATEILKFSNKKEWEEFKTIRLYKKLQKKISRR